MLQPESEAMLAAEAMAEEKRQARLHRRRERDRLMRFLVRGGVLVREDLGGVIGLRWGRAHRSGGSFDTTTCERLLDADKLKPAPFAAANAFVWRPGK